MSMIDSVTNKRLCTHYMVFAYTKLSGALYCTSLEDITEAVIYIMSGAVCDVHDFFGEVYGAEIKLFDGDSMTQIASFLKSDCGEFWRIHEVQSEGMLCQIDAIVKAQQDTNRN